MVKASNQSVSRPSGFDLMYKTWDYILKEFNGEEGNLVKSIDSALNYIRSKQQEQQQNKKPALDTIGNDNGNNNSDSQLTTPGGRQTVF
jgi:hypothetical protein